MESVDLCVFVCVLYVDGHICMFAVLYSYMAFCVPIATCKCLHASIQIYGFLLHMLSDIVRVPLPVGFPPESAAIPGGMQCLVCQLRLHFNYELIANFCSFCLCQKGHSSVCGHGGGSLM